MKHPEGMKLSCFEESILESTGILKQTSGAPVRLYGLSDEAVALFSLIAAAGEYGLTKSHIPKNLKEKLDEHLLPLEIQQLVTWERDGRGRQAYLVLTWKGEEALAAARPRKTASLSQRRRASLEQ